jgi:hypothetical protein
MADSAFSARCLTKAFLRSAADAGKFLQGQLTCNLNYLSDTRQPRRALHAEGPDAVEFPHPEPQGCFLAMAVNCSNRNWPT